MADDGVIISTLNHDASTHLSTTVPIVWVSMGSVIMAFLSLLQPGEHFANRAMLFASHHTHWLSFLVTTFYCQVPAYFRIVPILFMAQLSLFHFDRNLRLLLSTQAYVFVPSCSNVHLCLFLLPVY